jgi:hypothetical protein
MIIRKFVYLVLPRDQKFSSFSSAMGLVPELDSPTLYELTVGEESRDVLLEVRKQTEGDGIK